MVAEVGQREGGREGSVDAVIFQHRTHEAAGTIVAKGGDQAGSQAERCRDEGKAACGSGRNDFHSGDKYAGFVGRD